MHVRYEHMIKRIPCSPTTRHSNHDHCDPGCGSGEPAKPPTKPLTIDELVFLSHARSVEAGWWDEALPADATGCGPDRNAILNVSPLIATGIASEAYIAMTPEQRRTARRVHRHGAERERIADALKAYRRVEWDEQHDVIATSDDTEIRVPRPWWRKKHGPSPIVEPPTRRPL